MADRRPPTLGDNLNVIDRFVAWLDPDRGMQRLVRRQAFNAATGIKAQRAHEASEASRLRKFYSAGLGPNAIVQQSAAAIRDQVRHLARNNDIARGIVRTMVNNTVGASGVGIEPQPRRTDGTIHEEYARELRKLYAAWCRRPEVQRRYTMSGAQRTIAWAWLRDGEMFTQDVIGPVSGLQHATALPYSFEMFESDLVPFDHSQGSTRQGVDLNAWGQARGYYVYKGHPLDAQLMPMGTASLKYIEAARVRHLAFRDHVSQVRGISEFASIIARLEDIKDYEESERIAAKVAAMLTAYVKRHAGDQGYDVNDPTVVKKEDGSDTPAARQLQLAPGMIIDGLAVGEEIGVIDSKRPNPNVVTFRQGQLRAAAAGIGASYSSIAKAYDGTFSAQRQELVEQWVNYATLCDEFVGQWLQPTWETIVSVANLSGVLRIPRDVVPGTEDDALYIAQSMPWIDPYKEAMAWVTLARAGFASEIEIMRKRGVNPRDMLEQITQWRQDTAARGMVFTSNAASGAAVSPPTSGGAATATDPSVAGQPGGDPPADPTDPTGT